MKKIFIIICGIFITLLSNPVLAQADPGDDPDPVAAPIDGYVWVLAALGLVYVFLSVRAFTQQLGNTPQE
jgi:hypothetical protein